jgi:hypothetical protein
MRWRLGVPLLAVVAAGCSGFTPFPTAPPLLGFGEKNPGTRVAICYNGLKSTPEEIQRLGQGECPSHSLAERIGTDYRMDDCPAMTPARATFLCKTTK